MSETSYQHHCPVLGDLERRGELVKAGVMTAGEDGISRHRGLAMESHLVAYFESMQVQRAQGKTRQNHGFLTGRNNGR